MQGFISEDSNDSDQSGSYNGEDEVKKRKKKDKKI